jgi:hypothetical protein
MILDRESRIIIFKYVDSNMISYRKLTVADALVRDERV